MEKAKHCFARSQDESYAWSVLTPQGERQRSESIKNRFSIDLAIAERTN